MDVEINLDGKSETLRCTLAAAKRVNAMGGFQNAVNRVNTADLDYYIQIVAAGVNKKPADVEQAVFRTGLPALSGSLVKFINLLANGGKPFRPQKLSTIEIEGKTYAELNERGEPLYVDEEEPASGGETSGEG